MEWHWSRTVKIRGYLIDVDWEDPTLTVTGTTAAARVALRGQAHGDEPLVVTRDDLRTVTFKKAGALVKGSLVITTTTTPSTSCLPQEAGRRVRRTRGRSWC